MKKIFLFLVLGASIQLTGCASVSYKNICQTTDWEQKGFNEAKSGLPIQSDLSDCSGEKTTSARYTQGREKGINQFCTYQGGLAFGREGGTYVGTCPKTLEAPFKQGYLKGKAEFERQQLDKGSK